MPVMTAHRYYSWLADLMLRVVVPFPKAPLRAGGCSLDCSERGGKDDCDAPRCYRR